MKRDAYIDFSKGFLMIGIVWGHIITALSADLFHTDIWIHQFFRVYDLPMFMIISGFFLKTSFKRHNTREIIVNKLTMLLVPITFWNLIRGYFTLKGLYFLWAVLVSSGICIAGHCLMRKLNPLVETVFYMAIIVLLHIINIPFNLFYLFPFFCFGYYLKDISFQIPRYQYLGILLIFVVGLCFWKSDFTPWKCGYNAWMHNYNYVLIYTYRFVLGITGTFVMAGVFRKLQIFLPQKVGDFILKAGPETLALYILQFFIIETVLYKLVRFLPIPGIYTSHPNLVHCLIGYLIAPFTAIVTIFISLYIIRFLKSHKLTKWVFGFRYH